MWTVFNNFPFVPSGAAKLNLGVKLSTVQCLGLLIRMPGLQDEAIPTFEKAAILHIYSTVVRGFKAQPGCYLQGLHIPPWFKMLQTMEMEAESVNAPSAEPEVRGSTVLDTRGENREGGRHGS